MLEMTAVSHAISISCTGIKHTEVKEKEHFDELLQGFMITFLHLKVKFTFLKEVVNEKYFVMKNTVNVLFI